jgi:hypothetical protein
MTCQSKWKKMRFYIRVSSTVAFILPTYAIVYLIYTLEQWNRPEIYLLGNEVSISNTTRDEARGEVGKRTWNETEARSAHGDGKEHIISLLQEAGVTNIDNVTRELLPSWENITRFFGEGPRVIGLDQCQAFQENTMPRDRLLGVAGNFNTGTNLLYILLSHNCKVSTRDKRFKMENAGIMPKVPWGKHAPVDFRYRNDSRVIEDSDPLIRDNNVLTVIAVRDPYDWMNSMCRIGYSTTWKHTKDHCPNLIADERDQRAFPELKLNETVEVKIKYIQERIYHPSLAHFYSKWYTDYLEADFARVMIRMEDLVFHTKNVITQVCQCAGGTMNSNFRYMVDSAKQSHAKMGPQSSLVDVVMRYRTFGERVSNMTSEDLKLAQSAINSQLLLAFGYQIAVPP